MGRVPGVYGTEFSASYRSNYFSDEAYMPLSGMFPCHFCNKAFTFKSVLDRHMLIHTGERPYRCPLCPASFTQQSTLDEHRRRKHKEQSDLQCKICGEKFRFRRNYNNHIDLCKISIDQ